MICVFNFFIIHFYLFYLLLNGDEKDAKQRVFFDRLLVALKEPVV